MTPVQGGELGLDAAPTRCRSVRSVRLDGEIVLWRDGRLHRLDPIGSVLWDSVDGQTTIGDLAASAAEAFDVPVREIIPPVLDLCRHLDHAQLFEGSDGPRLPRAHAPVPTSPIVGPRERPGPPDRDFDHVPWSYTTGRFRALGHDFGIRSTDAAVGRYLAEALGAMRESGAPQHRYSIVERSAGGGYSLYLDDLDLVVSPDADGLIRHVLWHVNSEVIRKSIDHVLVHAAAAVIDGSAVIMPGGINAGKTTLVAGLLLAGHSYLTDELVALERLTGLVHAYPRPMNIGRGSWDVVPDLRPTGWCEGGAFPKHQWHVNPLSAPGARLSSPVGPRWVVAPQYVPGGGSRLEPLSRAEALQLLFSQLMNASIHDEVAFFALARVVEGAGCARLTVDTLEKAVSLVADLPRLVPFSGSAG